MKLESVGVRSIRVTLKDAKLVEITEKGAYCFGEFYVGSPDICVLCLIPLDSFYVSGDCH